ncbi:MAG: apiosidase-like domain-containing protein [Planctomycetota bacterium]
MSLRVTAASLQTADMIAKQHLRRPVKRQASTFAAAITCLTLFSTSLMASQTVERFGFFEASFQAADTYKNPYTDLQASAVIQRPDGIKRTLALFWDGADSWKIRISPDLAGKWRFKVHSTDDGLDGQTGEFTSVPSKRKGSIRPMPGFAHHFSRQDGTPFLLWGDTGWALYQDAVSEKLNRKAVFHYIDERAGQGVNVIHSMLLQEAGWGNRGGDPFESMAEETLNPAYWQEIDLRLQYLNEKGIIGGLVLAWGDKRKKEPYAWRLFPGVEARKRYARYIASRYSAYDVYFVVSGEWHAEIRTRANVTEQAIREEFIEIGDALHEADVHNRMIGIHPMTQRGSVREFNKASWMSFGDYQQNYRMLHERILESRSTSSGQARPHPGPIVNSEYGYFLRDSNFDGVVDKNNSFSADAMRHATWDIIMAGGYPVTGYGTTYMGGNRDKGPFNVDDPRNDVWEHQYHAAQRSSDRQIRLGPARGPKRTLMCPPETTYWLLAEQGEHYVAYVRDVTDKVTIKFGPDAVDLRRASLFDPRTGEKKSVDKNTLLKDRYEWSPPDSGDWVLHLARSAELDGGKYLKAVQDFADVIIEKGRDTYGNNHTPLFADGLHAGSLKPVIWKKGGQSSIAGRRRMPPSTRCNIYNPATVFYTGAAIWPGTCRQTARLVNTQVSMR